MGLVVQSAARVYAGDRVATHGPCLRKSATTLPGRAFKSMLAFTFGASALFGGRSEEENAMARCKKTVLAVLLLAGWALPAGAADLSVSPLQKIEKASPARAMARYHVTKVATAGWLPNATCGYRCSGWFPVILGVSY
jgi:hypothetical protein